MRKLWAVLLALCLLTGAALAEGGAIELSGWMYGDLTQAAASIGSMEWDGDWVYANDIVQAYVGDAVTLAGNTDNEIKFIMLNDVSGYALFGLQVGMDPAALAPYFNLYSNHSFEDNGTNTVFTLSERDDGYLEILWVVAREDRITHVIYEAGYGHD